MHAPTPVTLQTMSAKISESIWFFCFVESLKEFDEGLFVKKIDLTSPLLFEGEFELFD